MTRTFTHARAVRGEMPLFAGLIGPSGGGKTLSALRLATGIVRVTPGPIFTIDTEADRAKHYADSFAFEHVSFRAPFGPLDYLAAVEHCVENGARVVIVDSMSHEHEGPGGVLEMHDDELDRLAGRDDRKYREKMNFTAWVKPKRERQRLINTIVQLGIHFIACFRAKEKIDIVTGKDPVKLGWQPIAGDEYYYELPTRFLLPPGADGVPVWNVEKAGERAIVRLPRHFREIFATPRQLDEEHGEAMAKWAAGAQKALPAPAREPEAPPEVRPSNEELLGLVDEIEAAQDEEALKAIGDTHSKKPWSDDARATIKAAYTKRRSELRKEAV